MKMSNSFLIMRFDNDVYYNYLQLTTFHSSQASKLLFIT